MSHNFSQVTGSLWSDFSPMKIGLTAGACPRIQVVLHRREDLFLWHSPFSLGKRLIEKAIAKAE
jgi:hypothetical protein